MYWEVHMDDKLKSAERWYDNNVEIYSKFSSEVAQIIEKILKSKNIPYHSITYRVKDRESYLNKCKKNKYLNPVEDIMDVSGIRIITYTNNDVKKICEIIEKEFEIDSNNSGNKMDKMDENMVGYLSVHYIAKLNNIRTKLTENSIYRDCKCEIQIRTLLQHAWAEIEHDKNYKFSGVLPKDIRRRFYLVSGVLEMMDREFDVLSEEIDKYSKIVKEKTKENDFDIEIDTESLSQYMSSKFKNDNRIRNIVDKSIIEELNAFGFKTIQDIDQKLTEEVLKNLLHEVDEDTYIGLLRDLMILLDVDKYFKTSYQYDWTGMERENVLRLEKLGVKNIREYLNKFNIISY